MPPHETHKLIYTTTKKRIDNKESCTIEKHTTASFLLLPGHRVLRLDGRTNQGVEGIFHVRVGLRTSLHKCAVVLLRELLATRSVHLTLICQIALVADQHKRHVVAVGHTKNL